jgi:hypothetical protein
VRYNALSWQAGSQRPFRQPARKRSPPNCGG